jgi:hypothetical protein
MACLRRNRIHDTWLIVRLTQTTLGRVGPPTPPGQAGAEIREGTRKPHLSTICKLMHIDRTDQITVASKTAGAADPVSVSGFVTMPTARTLTRRSSFRASKARDVSSFGLVGKIIDVFAIFPQGHTLIVVSTMVSIADTMRIADEEGSHLVGDTKVDHFAGRFVALISDAPFIALAYVVLGPLQLLPTTGMLLATGLLLGKLSQLLGALPLERTDTASCDNEGLLRIGGDSSEVDFSQVYRSLFLTRSSFRPWYLDAHMQFKASIPDQRTGAAIFRKVDRQDNRFAPFAHWQKHPSFFFAHSLSGPFDRIKSLGTPGILHAHLWMGLTKLSGGFDIGKKGMDDHLNRLAMQSKAAFGGFLQVIAARLWCVCK